MFRSIRAILYRRIWIENPPADKGKSVVAGALDGPAVGGLSAMGTEEAVGFSGFRSWYVASIRRRCLTPEEGSHVPSLTG